MSVARTTRSRLRLARGSAALLCFAGIVAGCSSSGGESHQTSPTNSAAVTTVPVAANPSSTAPRASTTTAPPTTTAAPTTTPPTTTAPIPSGPAKRISKGRDVPIVALSFDAGSDTGYTADILDLLAREHIHASFGVTGKWAKSNPDLFRRIVAEGHHVINHTYDHSSMTGRSTGKAALDRAARAKELQQADAIFVELTGKSAKPWFRPPYGDIDTALDVTLGEEGYAYDALWSLDSLGWKGLSAPEITARCEKAIAPGAIFLFHVGQQSQDAVALPAIIAAIRKAGMQPGSVLDVI